MILLSLMLSWASAAPLGSHFMEGLNAANFPRVKEDARQGRIGGVIIFASAAADADQLSAKIRELRAVSKLPLRIAIDGEGGSVLRLAWAQAASAKEMGAKGDGYTREQAQILASSLKRVGVDLNLAPVVDVCSTENPLAVAERCFGATAEVVTARAGVFIRAHKGVGVMTTLKHFPGHGHSTADSHLGWTDISSTWTDAELEPYRRIFASGFDGAVMVGHLYNSYLDKELPASLSSKVIRGLLREKLGFKGLVLTDDLQMGAIARKYSTAKAAQMALEAGVDMVLIAQQWREENLAEIEKQIKLEP